jgi:hypothetical protein
MLPIASFDVCSSTGSLEAPWADDLGLDGRTKVDLRLAGGGAVKRTEVRPGLSNFDSGTIRPKVAPD